MIKDQFLPTSVTSTRKIKTIRTMATIRTRKSSVIQDL